MASLLERMNIPGPTTSNSVGPVRNKGNNRGSGSSPYNRNSRPPKGDINDTWKHDLFNGGDEKGGKSLGSRLSNSKSVPKINASIAEKALLEASGVKSSLSIKGASSRGNVVEVKGLAPGTTAEDVRAIFSQCGITTESKLMPSKPDDITVRVTFKHEADAQKAVITFNNQRADGRILTVKVVGGVNARLVGRIGPLQEDSVDALMQDDSTKSASKFRADSVQDERAIVMVAPPGADPKDYTPQPVRGRGGRGRGRGGRGRRGGRGGATGMDID
ncbi:hypothetical protein K474DRAFT_1592266 [Panus rudis PR-1116 ss-1]|nr:hypothetical protein K474DRAFT_1592266 [Panus rudis PR-1116 ss-1]